MNTNIRTFSVFFQASILLYFVYKTVILTLKSVTDFLIFTNWY